jgi:pimeloyl-ACP methyl ester carboxylesterase
VPIAKIGEININYIIQGMGEPILMIMGFGSSMEGWYFQIPFFSKHFRVVALDNRGVGGSDKPKGPFTTRMMADDVIHLMDHLEIEKAHIMGASMGGMIAQEISINYPERVNKLVLACTYAKRGETFRNISDSGKLSGSPAERMTSIIDLAFNKPLYRLVFGFLARLTSRARSDVGGIEGQSVAVMSHDALGRLGSITSETLVIVGTRDRLIDPAASEVIAGIIPNAKLVKIEGGSHTIMVENKDEFNEEVLKFLTNSVS